MQKTTQQLLLQCRSALANGADFPTIWHEILRPHPLVIGPPIQAIRDGQVRLEIQLISGRRFAFDSAAKEILSE